MMIDAVKNVASLSMTRDLGSIDTDNSLAKDLAAGATQALGATPAGAAGMTFASVLGGMASDAVSNLKGAETASMAGINGKANTRQVVDAVMQADQSLQTVMAIRDKVVSAFLDITKMQI